MEIFESRYFVINKTCMELLGLWPYSSRVKNYSRRCGLAIFLFSCYLPQFIRMHECFGKDLDEMIQNFGVILYIFGISVKLITGVTAEDKMRIVYENTARDFQTIVDKEERDILFKYAERGRTLSITFITYMCCAVVVFVSLPMGPLVLDYFIPLQNGSRDRVYIWNGRYLVDSDKHYYMIYAIEAFSSIMTVAILSAVGPTYQAVVEHCLALFAIVKFRLRVCTRGGKNAEKETYGLIVRTIRLHNEIVEFTRIIEASYTSYFLIEMGITILLMSLTSVVLISRLDRLFDSLRHIMIIFAVLMHMFYLTWPSQKMINHSTDLFHNTYSNEWYKCSIRCQNLLKFMALRCVEPSQLTAGGLYVMNFENYASLVKTSASYITALLSFR